MYFCLVDAILEKSEDHIVTIKHVTSAEEYLQEHFPTFPVLPGVMMLEAMVQAGRELLGADDRWVLCAVRALRYGNFVKPGATLRIRVDLAKRNDDGTVDLRGEATIIDPQDPENTSVAVSGRMTLRRPIPD